ncbi:phage baseplate upper protein [Acinetobacter ursingii]|uniref:Phage baseplate upper protein n=1 Tax=Acinetobacter ursingii TaxID=108980 RepID=A0AA46NRI1_9GAMM|nr:phage baseplate upper protein [Acinetobacter ursingii]UYF70491.1 phage baseplate upper protein [Acinetobacter ursingii]
MTAKFKIKINQGATLRIPFTWTSNGTPINLTGYSARMQIRPDIDSPTIIHELTSENSGISFEPSLGKFTIFIPASVTADFSFETAVYDLELIAPNNDVYRVIEGEVTLSREVTRE